MAKEERLSLEQDRFKDACKKELKALKSEIAQLSETMFVLFQMLFLADAYLEKRTRTLSVYDISLWN
jgi:hypothetical protein